MPSRLVVADIKWLLREFQIFPSMERKYFEKMSSNSRGCTDCCLQRTHAPLGDPDAL